MISYDRILNEMERQLQAARKTADQGEMREALSAIRSLCEVALSQGVENKTMVIPKMLTTDEVQPVSSLEGKPLEEEDANGGSLFDF